MCAKDWKHTRTPPRVAATRRVNTAEFERRSAAAARTRFDLPTTMLEIRDLEKTYPSGVRALKGVSLGAPAGVFGLLGPNGSGKTTLMKILATLLAPDSGGAAVGGVDLINDRHAARTALGSLPQEFGLYPSLTAEQTLHYFARLKGVADSGERARLVGALLERVNLADALRRDGRHTSRRDSRFDQPARRARTPRGRGLGGGRRARRGRGAQGPPHG